MDQPDPVPGSPARARRRLAICLWLALAFVVWNDVFDSTIINAGRDYLSRKALAERHLASDVTVFGIMRPAAVRGVIVASLWSLPIALIGLCAVWFAARRDEQARLAWDVTRRGDARSDAPPDA